MFKEWVSGPSKHTALKKRTFDHKKMGQKAAKRRNGSVVEHRQDDFGRSVEA